MYYKAYNTRFKRYYFDEHLQLERTSARFQKAKGANQARKKGY